MARDRAPEAPTGRSEDVTLRPTVHADLPTLFRFQSDAEANRMAVTRPRSRENFDRHWNGILANPDVGARTILADGEIAGSINRFPLDGKHWVGYWLGRSFWGRGIGTRGLMYFLREFEERPLFACIATSNVGSLRVVERCGFVRAGTRSSPETARFPACEETVFRLDAPEVTGECMKTPS